MAVASPSSASTLAKPAGMPLPLAVTAQDPKSEALRRSLLAFDAFVVSCGCFSTTGVDGRSTCVEPLGLAPPAPLAEPLEPQHVVSHAFSHATRHVFGSVDPTQLVGQLAKHD
jgi:hypothetical protein